MKILAIEIEKKGISNTDFNPHLKNEALKVLEYCENGFIREIYFDQNNCAIIIMEANTIIEVREKLNELPLVKNGLIDFEIRELKPYTGFSRLK